MRGSRETEHCSRRGVHHELKRRCATVCPWPGGTGDIDRAGSVHGVRMEWPKKDGGGYMDGDD